MAEILKLAKLVEHDGMADVDVRRRRVEAELAAQRLARHLGASKLLLELLLDEERVGAAANEGHRLADVVGNRQLLGFRSLL